MAVGMFASGRNQRNIAAAVQFATKRNLPNTGMLQEMQPIVTEEVAGSFAAKYWKETAPYYSSTTGEKTECGPSTKWLIVTKMLEDYMMSVFMHGDR